MATIYSKSIIEERYGYDQVEMDPSFKTYAEQVKMDLKKEIEKTEIQKKSPEQLKIESLETTIKIKQATIDRQRIRIEDAEKSYAMVEKKLIDAQAKAVDLSDINKRLRIFFRELKIPFKQVTNGMAIADALETIWKVTSVKDNGNELFLESNPSAVSEVCREGEGQIQR